MDLSINSNIPAYVFQCVQHKPEEKDHNYLVITSQAKAPVYNCINTDLAKRMREDVPAMAKIPMIQLEQAVTYMYFLFSQVHQLKIRNVGKACKLCSRRT